MYILLYLRIRYYSSILLPFLDYSVSGLIRFVCDISCVFSRGNDSCTIYPRDKLEYKLVNNSYTGRLHVFTPTSQSRTSIILGRSQPHKATLLNVKLSCDRIRLATGAGGVGMI